MQSTGKIFWASFLTLIAAGMGFAVRGGVLAEWGSLFGFTQTELGEITGFGLAPAVAGGVIWAWAEAPIAASINVAVSSDLMTGPGPLK